MNATAVPCPAATRSVIPATTVPSHAATPAGASASGHWRARAPRQHSRLSQPIASPARNGHAVDAMPPRVSPLVWLARPRTTKASTQQASMATASSTRMRMPPA
jgi:hypothetical protein